MPTQPAIEKEWYEMLIEGELVNGLLHPECYQFASEREYLCKASS